MSRISCASFSECQYPLRFSVYLTPHYKLGLWDLDRSVIPRLRGTMIKYLHVKKSLQGAKFTFGPESTLEFWIPSLIPFGLEPRSPWESRCCLAAGERGGENVIVQEQRE